MYMNFKHSCQRYDARILFHHLTCFFVVVLFVMTIPSSVQGQDDPIDYCLELHAGANLISFYALPEDNSIANVMAPVLGNVTSVIGEGVAASYDDNTGWKGTITTISPLSGYWVELDKAASLCLTQAIPTDVNTEYQLHAGNNLVSFPFPGSVPISDAIPDAVESSITGIIGEGVAATNNNGQGWLGSLRTFTGGKGYWIHTSQPVSFTFQVPEPSSLLLLLAGMGLVVCTKPAISRL